MGPRSEERGNDCSAVRRQRRSHCFNGAALRRARKLQVIAVLRARTHVASMGPRSEERGNHCRHYVRMSGACRLQWGRAPKSAEMTRPAAYRTCWRPCFNGAAIRRARKLRQFVDGHAARGIALQWGRAPKSAETREASQRRDATSWLQWGRAPMSAEIVSHSASQRDSIGGFNGAALRRARKLQLVMELGPVRLQWGRDPKIAEASGRDRKAVWQTHRFNGAALRRSRKWLQSRATSHGIELQWGRDPKSAEIGTASRSLRSSCAASMGPRSDDRGNVRSSSRSTTE